MVKKLEKEQIDIWLDDLTIQAENPAFKMEEMMLCIKCERKSPPTRLDCFYCGAQLALSEAQSKLIKPSLRKLESWEKGFNIIYSPISEKVEDSKLSEIAKILKSEKEVLQKTISVQKHLPLARVESEKEAEIIQIRLRELGAETLIVTDESLNIEKSTPRLRGLDFYDDKIILIFFNQDAILEISNNDLALIVTGAVFERKVESTQKRVKKGESKILETSETASDEFLIDIYSRGDATGYRIFAKGFDFSCLEAEKELLAVKNLRILTQKLVKVAPAAKFVDDYIQVRENLGNVWEVEERIDSQGMKREGFGKFNLGNVTTINNLSQFTKYSRLRRQLL